MLSVINANIVSKLLAGGPSTPVTDPTEGMIVDAVQAVGNTFNYGNSNAITFKLTITNFNATNADGLVYEAGAVGRGHMLYFSNAEQKLIFPVGSTPVGDKADSVYIEVPYSELPSGTFTIVTVVRRNPLVKATIYINGQRKTTKESTTSLSSWGASTSSGYGVTSADGNILGTTVPTLTGATLATGLTVFNNKVTPDFDDPNAIAFAITDSTSSITSSSFSATFSQNRAGTLQYALLNKAYADTLTDQQLIDQVEGGTLNSAPVGTVTLNDDGNGLLSWVIGYSDADGDVSGASTYTLYSSVIGDFTDKVAVTSSGTTQSYASGQNGYAYRVELQPRAATGKFSGSQVISNVVTVNATAPATPSNFAVPNPGSAGATATWTDVARETSYRIRSKRTADGTFGAWVAVAANATSYAFTGLDASTSYDAELQSQNSFGDSASATVTFSTIAAGSSFAEAHRYQVNLVPSTDPAGNGPAGWNDVVLNNSMNDAVTISNLVNSSGAAQTGKGFEIVSVFEGKTAGQNVQVIVDGITIPASVNKWTANNRTGNTVTPSPVVKFTGLSSANRYDVYAFPHGNDAGFASYDWLTNFIVTGNTTVTTNNVNGYQNQSDICKVTDMICSGTGEISLSMEYVNTSGNRFVSVSSFILIEKTPS